ncbi:MAG: DapH/DapD/GlmU-related protein [Methylobacter sp.]|uniref:serine O-acetyltransferase n=1 Tax=Methylobacter sp. TaxID=2051955 RepID=UPI002731C7B6|nr:DapH/DapD/GlmU-related protein [Methylobacter sp.]MDP1664624.1 DapH/DapD/GlmU-related protein [Methylobacter sp.]
MFENIRADTMRVHRREESLRAIDVLRLLWEYYGLRALVIYRFGRWLGSIRKQPFGWAVAAPLYPAYWILSTFVNKAYGINLEQNADIGAGLYIGHYGGIEVRNCRIGPYCSIQQQVKLGAAAAKGPVIGERVWIGAHSRICGDINVGDGATIAAGTVIVQDVPHHCLALGNPSRIAQRDYDNRAIL